MEETIVYSGDNCVFCGYMKSYLDSKGVNYTVKNVSQDADAKDELIALGHKSVPVLISGQLQIVGFNKDILDQHF